MWLNFVWDKALRCISYTLCSLITGGIQKSLQSLEKLVSRRNHTILAIFVLHVFGCPILISGVIIHVHVHVVMCLFSWTMCGAYNVDACTVEWESLVRIKFGELALSRYWRSLNLAIWTFSAIGAHAIIYIGKILIWRSLPNSPIFTKFATLPKFLAIGYIIVSWCCHSGGKH